MNEGQIRLPKPHLLFCLFRRLTLASNQHVNTVSCSADLRPFITRESFLSLQSLPFYLLLLLWSFPWLWAAHKKKNQPVSFIVAAGPGSG